MVTVMSKRRPKVSLREAVNARRDEVAMVNVMAPLMVMHQRLNDAFFDKLGAVGEHPLSPDARALMRCQLHDVVLSGYQVQPRSTDASRRRGSQLRGLAKRVRALSSEIELVICEENLCESLPPACKVQDWMPFAKSIGLPLVMRAFADEADLRGCAKEKSLARAVTGHERKTERCFNFWLASTTASEAAGQSPMEVRLRDFSQRCGTCFPMTTGARLARPSCDARGT